MSAKVRSIVLILIGVALVVLSLFADVLGVGAHAGLGWKQMAGAALGVVVAIVGLLGMRGSAS